MEINCKLLGVCSLVSGTCLFLVFYFEQSAIEISDKNTLGKIIDIGLGTILILMGVILVFTKNTEKVTIQKSYITALSILLVSSIFIFLIVASFQACQHQAGTVKDRSQHYLDGIYVWAERIKIWRYRRKEAAVYKLAKWSKQPLQVSLKSKGLFNSQKAQW